MGSRFFTLFLFPLLFVPILARAADSADLERRATERKLWENSQWIKLVHYEKNYFGGVTSQADGPSFFLSPNGKTDPKAEMIATIRAFFRLPTPTEIAKPKTLADPEIQAALKKTVESYEGHGATKDEQERQFELKRQELLAPSPDHPICHFPARLRFLKRELGWSGEGLPEIKCYRLDDFRRRVDAKSAALVFSSFFLNNPSSTFGHSFLRVNSGLWAQYGNYRNELLDTGVNFAANVNTANPALYALFGMIGLMPGTFTTVPYYIKVREYNDFESRDLWSYDLDLTPEEIAMLIDHIWEEQSTFYFYYYFTENCSYHMFTLLDAAAPRFDLTRRLPFYVIPSDTIRVLNQTPGIVKHITFRPSVRSQFLYRLSLLSSEEKEALDRLVDSGNPDVLDPALSKVSAARVLDTYSDQIELVSAKELIIDGSDAQKLKQKVLIKRASLDVKSDPLEVPAPLRSAPHLAHGMRRISLGFDSEEDRGTSTTLGYKFSMHEILDPGLGYARNMQVDMFSVRGRVLNRQTGFRNRFEFDEFNIFKLTALTPISRYYQAKSIRAEFGLKRTYDRDCENSDRRCFPIGLDYGPGWAVDPTGTETITLFAFLQGRFTYSPNYQGLNFRLGAGPRVGSVLYFNDSLRFTIHAEMMARLWAEDRFVFAAEGALRWGFKSSFAVDISGRRQRDINDAMAQLHYYY